jgi:hypothetical protein
MESVISFLLTVQEHHSRIWDNKSARDSFLATAQHPSLSPPQMLDNLLKARRGPDLSNREYGILKSKVDTCYKEFREKGKLTKKFLDEEIWPETFREQKIKMPYDLRALHHTGTVLLTHLAIVERYLNKEEREAEEKELAKFKKAYDAFVKKIPAAVQAFRQKKKGTVREKLQDAGGAGEEQASGGVRLDGGPA